MASSSSSGAAPVAKPRPEPRRTEVRKYMKQDKKGQKAGQLKGIVGIHGTSLASMRHILNSVVDEDERLTRQMLRDIAHTGFAEVRRDVTFPLADEGGEVVVPVADPSSLVAMSVRASETLQEVFVAAMQHHPGTPEAPWHLLVTWDEFTPGSMHNPVKPKKAMVLNFSFQELGVALHSDRCWWTMAVVRTSIIGQVERGWSRMLRDLLKMALLGVTGLESVGIPVMVHDQCAVIHCKVGCLLSDGDGIRLALQWMGASSLHPCFRRWNLFIELCFHFLWLLCI